MKDIPNGFTGFKNMEPDFRYYKSYCEWAGIADPSLEALVRDKGIQDVIVLNNIYNTAADELLPYLEELCKSNG